MTIKIYSTVTGFFVFDKDAILILFESYPKETEVIATKIHNLSQNNKSEELEKIFKEILTDEIETNSLEVMDFAKNLGKKCELNAKSSFYQEFVERLPQLLIEKGYITSEIEYNQLVKDVSIILSKKRVTDSSERIDKNVVHGILSMDDIDKTTNLFASRIREWYGVHFPEIIKEVQSNPTLCKIITNVGIRDNFTEDSMKSFGFSNEKSKHIVQLAKSSMGAKFEQIDLVPLRDVAQNTVDLFEERDKLEAYIEREIGKIAPNMQAVVGSAIAARMIALAGGLRELAMKPASTVQLLGAEKALFRALKTGAKPPKHGIIFQMPELHSCPWWQRGNIARAIAGRLTIAVRVDAFRGEFIGDQLKADVNNKIVEIKEKYSEPPEGKKPPIDRYQQFPPRRDRKPEFRRSKGNKKSYKRRR
ncbi:MAG: C/D box methylation guide ribonucleoprotein complex aNOP56 subunit [Candidatus Heimdallarchaeota archaeon]|nr:C/D box methylation guide ribonucleoprotein complex aNOP56 subunit [Candidatus Heimdallarchaeota archaeon]MCK4954880.1 C/D box methylation guide ribonucleoprotein complex aNOP56 subunit [Candidatus Heimdallarchaeota archaeon]